MIYFLYMIVVGTAIYFLRSFFGHRHTGSTMCCKDECQPGVIKLHHPQFYSVLSFEWPVHHVLFMTYRLIAALYFTSIFVASLLLARTEQRLPYWPCYLTNWTLIFLVIQLWLYFVAVIYYTTGDQKLLSGLKPARPIAVKTSSHVAHQPSSLKALWFLTTVAYTGSLSVCVLFWVLLYPGLSKPMSPVSVNVHLVNGIFCFLDVILSGLHFRIAHLVYSIIFGFAYGAFTIIYYKLGGKNEFGHSYIYAKLDWSKPSIALMYLAIVLFGLIPITHILLFCLAKIRWHLRNMCRPKRWKSIRRGSTCPLGECHDDHAGACPHDTHVV